MKHKGVKEHAKELEGMTEYCRRYKKKTRNILCGNRGKLRNSGET